jgi:hypothetical protein
MKWLAMSALTISLAVPAGLMTTKAAAQPANPAGFYQDRPWDQPPDEFRDVQKRGFHDGIEAARKDFDAHRDPNPERHEMFKHPHVDPSMRDDYRDGFRHGYDAATHHMMAEHHE